MRGRQVGGSIAARWRTRGDVQKRAYYITPTVFVDAAPTARICQEEIFGPVLAVIKSTSFEDAIDIANNTEYGLTGALYSSSADKLNHARNEFQVGNLYLNRKCTGAMVGAHPFRRLQHVRNRLQGRWPGLPAALHTGKVDR